MIQEHLLSIEKELPSGVSLVAVSKFHPVERLLEAYGAGQRIFAESRPQELAAKVPRMPSDVQWHFIGHLQTNKLKLVLPYVALVQSVDSEHLLSAIDRSAQEHGRIIDILLEVHISSDTTKQGFSEEETYALISGEAPKAGVRIRGLMGMASLTGDETVIEGEFARLEALFHRVRADFPALRDTFTELSMGMSSDWKIAVRHGATMVRIGTDIFGPREY